MSDAAFPSRRGLTGDALKLLAILAMTLDHIAWLLFPGYPAQAMPLAMHIIGRLTCPIMCYFIAEGYHYTRNFRRYALRLFLLAIVSHFAYTERFRGGRGGGRCGGTGAGRGQKRGPRRGLS